MILIVLDMNGMLNDALAETLISVKNRITTV